MMGIKYQKAVATKSSVPTNNMWPQKMATNKEITGPLEFIEQDEPASPRHRKDSMLKIRVDHELHAEFKATCKRRGRDQSEIMRHLMTKYILDHVEK